MTSINWSTYDAVLLGFAAEGRRFLTEVFGASTLLAIDPRAAGIEEARRDGVPVVATPWQRLRVREAVRAVCIWEGPEQVAGDDGAHMLLEHALDLAQEVVVVGLPPASPMPPHGRLQHTLEELDVREYAVVPAGAGGIILAFRPACSPAVRRQLVRAARRWAADDEKPSDLGVRAVRFGRFVGTAGTVAVSVRSDAELVTVQDDVMVPVEAPVAGDLVDGLAGDYTALPVFVAGLDNCLISPSDGLVLTSRDELVHETLMNDRLVEQSRSTRDLAALAVERATADRLTGPHIVLGNPRAPNYYHWWFDSLARVWLADAFTPWRGSPLVAGEQLAPFQRDALKALGLEGRTVIVANRPIVLERAIVSPGPAGGSVMLISPLARDFATWASGCLGVVKSPHRRLFVSRQRAAVRRLVGEDVVMHELAALGFERVCLEALDVRAQAEIFAEAEFIVSPHGAGLTNLLFAPHGTGVVELFSKAGAHDSLYRRLASLLGHHYAAVTGPTHPGARTRHAANMSIDPEHLVSTVAAVETARNGG